MPDTANTAGAAEAAGKQHYTFQAEIKRLLGLLSESLYQNREITLRELVSNASDALDKMRLVQLTEPQYRDDTDLVIHLEPDETARTLTVRDNGIGMTQRELVENLGTIAHSGTLEFFEQLAAAGRAADASLIGQFGVGFYSAFMLAERVEVLSRSYKEDHGWRWESDGSGSFTIEPAEGLGRGTSVVLHLKSGEAYDDFTRKDRLRYIVRRYSTFVPHPIRLGGEVLNDQRPIWVEPKSKLTDDDYAKFYQHLSHHTEETPLWHLHLSADSPIQFNAILYCPRMSFEKLGFGRGEHGLHLCAKRILVQDNNRDLLPEYLRFLYGLVDSTDLPLNVSREALQDNTIFRKIRKVLVKKVLDHLESLSSENAETYRTFIEDFGSILREGVGDFENRERIGGLLRFRSSHTTGDGRTSLDEYLSRAGEEQKTIYFLGGPDVSAIENSPNLEIFRKRGVEVLYLTDPLDEFALSHLGFYKEHPLLSIDTADVEPPAAKDAESKPDEEETKKPESEQEPSPGFEKLLTLFRDALGDSVAEVKRSKRLTDSPVCLVNPAGTMSAQMQKIMQMAGRDLSESKRIFEVNPHSPLIRRLSDLTANADHDNFIRECARQLHANTLLLEGMAPDTEGMVGRIHQFMTELAQKRSPIVT
jgi:molecular chaperone HtpG